MHFQEPFARGAHPEPYQNGQIHTPQQQLHHADLRDVIDAQQQRPQQTQVPVGHHQGTSVTNIQSFINQAAAASNNQPPKPEHDQFKAKEQQFQVNIFDYLVIVMAKMGPNF